MGKLYDLKDLTIVILAKMTQVIKPSSEQFGHYKSKSLKGAFFARKVHQIQKTQIYHVITKDKYYNDSPEENLNKGAKYILKKFDAGVVFAKPIEEKGKSKLTITQLRALEKVFNKKGYVTFDAVCPENSTKENG